jgi:hypothetical protein
MVYSESIAIGLGLDVTAVGSHVTAENVRQAVETAIPQGGAWNGHDCTRMG